MRYRGSLAKSHLSVKVNRVGAQWGQGCNAASRRLTVELEQSPMEHVKQIPVTDGNR